ncbi:MAG: 1-(5-phosphoribosyl)-5-[(5-phosphoribosylamino)methylideneamino]imidazole-4-carboxamide isomerase [Aquificaceae bacterium]|nr:1-(5-phosphoribosyl)-5-[(5-phosphoribosylamino)methylideneamino]imidazole-4-carboxamide isomerase [Aquificaceae bacterium]
MSELKNRDGLELQDRIIPAIDLLNQQVVRLKAGDFSSAKVYSKNPEEIAKRLSDAGFKTLHVVDLKGSLLGNSQELKILERLRSVFAGIIQFGGGLRSQDMVRRLNTIGINRFVIGTLALKDQELFVKIVEEFPQKVILSIDSKGGKVATDGWSFRAEVSPKELITYFDKLKLWGYLSTDIEKDGTLKGVNPEFYKELKRETQKPIIASGGVASIDDVKTLLDVADFVIVGKALYEGRLSPWDDLFKG